MKPIKSNFTIQQIGPFRFYSGLIVGLLFSLTLYLFFQYFIQISNVLATTTSSYWPTAVKEESSFYASFFWSLLSISIAFSFTSYLWTSKPILSNRRETRINRLAQMNALFIFALIFFMVNRILQLYIQFHIVDFQFKEEFGALLFLAPLFIFTYNWMFIARIYKSTKPFLISMIAFILYGLLLTVIKI